MKILAIETSCDDTSAAVVENGRRVLSNVVCSQNVHSKFGGVVPELASRFHLENINSTVERALKESGVDISKIDAIAFSASPGLIGSLLIGQITAETIAYIFKKKLIPVNHLEGHIYSPTIEHKNLRPPFLSLVVSGGHTDLILIEDFGRYKILGRSRDDAAGEAFDKVAKLLGLRYPGGPEVEKWAKRGDPNAIKFPRPFMYETWDFSFSGLKTAVLYYLKKTVNDYPSSPVPYSLSCNICASFEAAVVETLVEKLMLASKKFNIKKLAICGGVASNKKLREALASSSKKEKIRFFVPSPQYCTDNAAMIASAAYYKLKYNCIASDCSVSSSSELLSWR